MINTREVPAKLDSSETEEHVDVLLKLDNSFDMLLDTVESACDGSEVK